jgi:hypothetical protein
MTHVARLVAYRCNNAVPALRLLFKEWPRDPHNIDAFNSPIFVRSDAILGGGTDGTLSVVLVGDNGCLGAWDGGLGADAEVAAREQSLTSSW